MMNAVTVMREWVEITDMLSFEQKGRLFSAVFKYSLYGVEPKLEGRLKCFYLMMKPEIDKSNVRRKAQEKSRQKRHLQKDLQTDVQKGLQKDLQTDVQKDLQNDLSPSSPSPPPRVPPIITPTQPGYNAHARYARKPSDAISFADRLPVHLKKPEVIAKWQEWESYRKKTKRTISDIAASRQIAFLSKYPPDIAMAIIDQSIANDWQGLFPPKGVKPQSPSSDKPI